MGIIITAPTQQSPLLLYFFSHLSFQRILQTISTHCNITAISAPKKQNLDSELGLLKHYLSCSHRVDFSQIFNPMLSKFFSLHILFIFLLINSKGISGATVTLINRCNYVVWPGILANSGSAPLDSTGFQLPPGEARYFRAPPGWSGRFWGRTGCAFDPVTGQGGCATGDCGSNQVECKGTGAAPPATLAEFTIGSSSSSGRNTGAMQDFYDVSLVDGYNLPMMVEPSGGSGACGSTGCATDLNRVCPNELRAGQSCKSACEAFGSPEYCCSGEYGSPTTCRPSSYSEMFKNACPRAYSYAFDDATSTFTCTGADYTITFCPKSTSQKSSRDSSSDSSPTSVNGPPVATGAVGSGSHPGSQAEDPDPFTSWLPNFMTRDSSSSTIARSFGFQSSPFVPLIITSAVLCLLQS